MYYLLMLTAAVLFMIQTLSFKEFNRGYMKNMASYFLFNFIYFGLSVLGFLALAGRIESFHPYTLGLGVIFGILFIITILSYMKAMETGPLSYSALFFSFGIIVPILFGLIFWKENISWLQLTGLLLLLATFYIGQGPSGKGEQKLSGKWLLFCLFAFVGNGSLMTISKSHQMLLPGQQIYEFLILSFGIAALISLLLMLWYHFKKKQTVTHFKAKPMIWISLGAGISTAVGNNLALYLTSRLPSVVLFPSMNGGTVLLSTLASSLFYKEKLDKKGILGLLIGLVALILLSA